MKKNNSKTKSPAPATPAAKSKKKTSSKAVSTPAAVPTPVVSAPVAETAPAPVKAVASATVQTKIVARIDVGFGNTLYIRGEGPGLSWTQGVPMECVASDQWEITLGESAQPVSFKLLLNDATWCTGPDSVVASGSTVTLTPEFA